MPRKDITPEVVANTERLLAKGLRSRTIADRLGITQYVVNVIAKDDGRRDRSAPPLRHQQRLPNSQSGIDAATIRTIQRMLAAAILPHEEIAREAGVSVNTVSDVATGKRIPVTLSWLPHSKDERLVREPIRCSVCHAMLSVVPCRACRARRQ